MSSSSSSAALPPNWRALDSVTTLCLQVDALRDPVPAVDARGVILPHYYEVSVLCGNQQIRKVWLRYYDNQTAALRLYDTLYRLRGVRNVINCEGLYEDTSSNPPRTALIFKRLPLTLSSFLNILNPESYTTRVPRPKESERTWSSTIIRTMRELGRTIEGIRMANLAHGKFSTTTIFVESKPYLPLGHSNRLVLKLTLPSHPNDLYDGTGKHKGIEQEMRADYNRLVEILEPVGTSLGIVKDPMFQDLLEEMRRYRICTLKQFLTHPSLWLPSHKINFLLKITEPCEPWQFNNVLKKFKWKDQFRDLFQQFSVSQNKSGKEYVLVDLEYTDDFKGFVHCLRSILAHFDRASYVNLRAFFHDEQETVLRRFEGFCTQLFKHLIVVARAEQGHGFVSSRKTLETELDNIFFS